MKNIDIKDNIVRRNRIPILIYTTDWIQLFSNYRSKSMKKIISKLEGLLSKEKDLEEELKEVEKKKKILMSRILHLSSELDGDSNNLVIDKLDKAKKEIIYINDRIPKILEELEDIPFEIDNQNTILLKETITKAYNMINKYEKESVATQGEINKIRKILGSLIQKKVDLEEDINKLYSYLHGIMGASEMEKLDDNFLDIDNNENLR